MAAMMPKIVTTAKSSSSENARYLRWGDPDIWCVLRMAFAAKATWYLVDAVRRGVQRVRRSVHGIRGNAAREVVDVCADIAQVVGRPGVVVDVVTLHRGVDR